MISKSEAVGQPNQMYPGTGLNKDNSQYLQYLRWRRENHPDSAESVLPHHDVNPSEFFEGNGPTTASTHEKFFVHNPVTIVAEKWTPSEWHDWDCGIAGGFPHPASAHDWTTAEPDEVIEEFIKLLRGPTGDGAGKRRAGEKVSWKVDPGHIQAAYRHLGYYADGELADKDSKCHPLVHAAWRLLARAWQDNQDFVKEAN